MAYATGSRHRCVISFATFLRIRRAQYIFGFHSPLIVGAIKMQRAPIVAFLVVTWSALVIAPLSAQQRTQAEAWQAMPREEKYAYFNGYAVAFLNIAELLIDIRDGATDEGTGVTMNLLGQTVLSVMPSSPSAVQAAVGIIDGIYDDPKNRCVGLQHATWAAVMRVGGMEEGPYQEVLSEGREASAGC